MRLTILPILLSLYPGNAGAAQEQLLQAPEIISLLANQKVKGEDFEQSFGDPTGHASASTTYWQGGNASFGRWRVEGDAYCSQWPPTEFWTCYKVATYDENALKHVIWIASDGSRYIGHIVFTPAQ